MAPWFGLLAPGATPAEVVKRINEDVAVLLKTKEVMDAFAAQGAEPFSSTPAAFNALLRNDIEKWAVVVKETGAKLD